MKTCYIFLAEGFEEVEALTVVDLLRRDRLNVEMVSIADTDTVTGSHGI
ncbi:MAG TPA: DJ-1 family protein, partial [Lachnospiraceae bacterium]|nr:DJ-1 family protein [Lachnospiraceae bacterium]